MIERQELFCHECRCYVQFSIDLSLNGNHVLNCPNCGHQHCRVVRNGRITDIRWDNRNFSPSQTYYALAVTSTAVSCDYTSASGTSYCAASWMNSTADGT